MAVATLTSGNDLYDAIVEGLIPTGSETSNAINGLAGDDVIYGSNYVDFISGGTGNDFLAGRGGNDVLLGEAGNDVLVGDAGNDLLVGGDGVDVLYGGTGSDRLFGGTGDDLYQYNKGDGSIDVVNDDLSAALSTGFGGGNDLVKFYDVVGADLRFYQFGNDLVVTDVLDIQDGQINTGVLIDDFFLGGNNTIEAVIGSDNQGYDTSLWV